MAVLFLALIRVPFNMSPQESSAPLPLGELPRNLLFSWLRMTAAYLASLVFSILIGSLAATNERRSKILLPVIDVLQSVPILGFFPTAIYWFVRMGGQQVGIEMAVIFLIFTCQSWNLVFAVYDSIKNIPEESLQAARSLGLGELALFRTLYLPAAFPRLVDNSVLSWANGWYFLMASEIIALGSLSYQVSGVGSFLQNALDHGIWSHAIIGIAGLVAVIISMDALLWRPLRALSQQFRFESSKRESTESGTGENMLNFYRHSWSMIPLRAFLYRMYRAWLVIERFFQPPTERGIQLTAGWKWGATSSLALFWSALTGIGIFALIALGKSVIPPWSISPLTVFASILVSGSRIVLAYLVSLLWILPLVYWAHRNPKWLRWLQSSAQVAASIPATAFFPLIILAVMKTSGMIEIAVMLLLMTGMQWYLLFNILGGAAALPNDIREVGESLGIKKKLYIKRIFLPSIVTALVTGSITAVGGGWNALIIAEYSKAGSHPYSVFGVGSILNKATFETGDEKLLSLSLLLMVSFIVFLNRFFWQPIYRWSEKKFRLEG